MITAYPGEKPVFVGQTTLTNADYVTMTGLTFKGDHSPALTLSGGTGWKIVGNEMYNSDKAAIIFLGPNRSGAQDPATNGTNFVISGNCIHDNVSTGPNPVNYHGIYITDDRDILQGSIDHNIFYNIPNGQGIKFEGAKDMVISYNTFYRTAGGIAVYSPGRTTMRNNLVTHQLNTSSKMKAALTPWNPGSKGTMVSGLGWWKYPAAISSRPQRPFRGPGNPWDVYGWKVSGLVKADPQYDKVGNCQAFHPTNPKMTGFGAWAGR